MKMRTVAKILSMALALSSIFSISSATYAAEKKPMSININDIVNIKPLIPNPFPWPHPVPAPNILTPEKKLEFQKQKLDLDYEIYKLRDEKKEIEKECQKLKDEFKSILNEIERNQDNVSSAKEWEPKLNRIIENKRLNRDKRQKLDSKLKDWRTKAIKYLRDTYIYTLRDDDLSLKVSPLNIDKFMSE